MAVPVRQSRRGAAARHRVPGGIAGAASRRRRAQAEMGMCPSGVPMPYGDIPRPGGVWRMVYSNDFLTDVPVGSFPGPVDGPYGNDLHVYQDGWVVNGSFGPGEYNSTQTFAVNGSIIRKYLKVVGGVTQAAAFAVYPGGDTSGQLYGRYTVRWRSTSQAGWHPAWLLIPVSGNWPTDGEIDFPECESDATVYAVTHRQNGVDGGDIEVFESVVPWGGNVWHTTTIEWLANDLSYWLDGNLVGRSTARVPNTAQNWVIQTDSSYAMTPPSTAQLTVEIDWIAMYAAA